MKRLYNQFTKPDKIKHMIAGFVISLIVGWGAYALTGEPSNLWFGFIVAATIGFIKEVIDTFTPGRVEFNDFLATAVAGVPPVLPFFFL